MINSHSGNRQALVVDQCPSSSFEAETADHIGNRFARNRSVNAMKMEFGEIGNCREFFDRMFSVEVSSHVIRRSVDPSLVVSDLVHNQSNNSVWT